MNKKAPIIDVNKAPTTVEEAEIRSVQGKIHRAIENYVAQFNTFPPVCVVTKVELHALEQARGKMICMCHSAQSRATVTPVYQIMGKNVLIKIEEDLTPEERKMLAEARIRWAAGGVC